MLYEVITPMVGKGIERGSDRIESVSNTFTPIHDESSTPVPDFNALNWLLSKDVLRDMQDANEVGKIQVKGSHAGDLKLVSSLESELFGSYNFV